MTDPGITAGNLFAALPVSGAEEAFKDLFASPAVRIEHIV